MGKIFTWGEIAEKKIPTVDGIEKAKADILQWSEEMIDAGNFDGARLVGSSVRSPHRRGDIDLILSTQSVPVPYEASSAIREFQLNIATRYHVTLDSRFWEVEAESGPTPRISFIMLAGEPLRDTVRGKDPLRSGVRSNTTLESELASFARNHRLYFGKRLYHHSHTQEANLLHSSLDAVKKFGAMVRAVRGEGLGVDKLTGYDYLTGLLPDSVGRSVLRIEEIDRDYDAVLDTALSGDLGREDYENFVMDTEKVSKGYAHDFFTYAIDPSNMRDLLERPLAQKEGNTLLSPFERR